MSYAQGFSFTGIDLAVDHGLRELASCRQRESGSRIQATLVPIVKSIPVSSTFKVEVRLNLLL